MSSSSSFDLKPRGYQGGSVAMERAPRLHTLWLEALQVWDRTVQRALIVECGFSGVVKGGGGQSAPGGVFMEASLWAML